MGKFEAYVRGDSQAIVLLAALASMDLSGGVAEWSIAAALKAVVGVSPPWVRILPPPPVFWVKNRDALFFSNIKCERAYA